MTKTITLVGALQFEGSKCGLRYLEFHASTPYEHVAQLRILATDGQSDDDLNTALAPFLRKDLVVTISARLDEFGDLIAHAHDITVGEPTPEATKADLYLRGSSDGHTSAIAAAARQADELQLVATAERQRAAKENDKDAEWWFAGQAKAAQSLASTIRSIAWVSA